MNGKKLQGDPLNLHFTFAYWVFNESTLRDVQTNTVFAASSKDIVALDYFTGKIVANYEDLFVDLPAQRNVQALFSGPSDVHVCVDNTVYTMYNSRYNVYKQFIIKRWATTACRPTAIARMPLCPCSSTRRPRRSAR